MNTDASFWMVTRSGFLAVPSRPDNCMLTRIRTVGVTNTNDVAIVMQMAIMLREGQDILKRGDIEMLCSLITFNPI